jgi:hypothetical protein
MPTNNTLLTDSQLQALIIDGEALLLVRYEDGMEDFHRYGANELLDVFTAEQIEGLATAQVVEQRLPITGEIGRWVNMLGAARFRLENA